MKDRKLGVAGGVSLVFAALNVIGLLATVGYSLYFRHQFTEIFEELEVALPLLTQLMLSVHWFVWIIVTLISVAILLVKELIAKKWIPLLINGIFLILGILYWAIFAIAMMLPLRTLIQQLEG